MSRHRLEPARRPRRGRRCRAPTGRARRPAPATGGRCLARRRPWAAVARAVAVAVAVVAEEALAVGGRRAGSPRRRRRASAAMSASSLGQQAEPRDSRKPASMTSRWSSVGPPLPTLYEIAAFGSPVLDSRMKYGCGLSEPVEVTVQSLMLRWNSSATPRQTAGRGAVAVPVGDPRGGDQAGDLGGDRRGREAALLLPALGPERRPVADHEVGGRLDVVLVERRGR